MIKHYIAVDIGGTNTKIALINKRYDILEKLVLETRYYTSPKELLKAVSDGIQILLKIRKLTKKNISGIGIGIAGLVDFKKGIVHSLTNIPGWNNVNLKKVFEQKIGIRTFVDNDVNVMTLGEFHRGAGRGAKDLVCITLGTGVGGGIVINGELYRGSTFSAGEIGHIPISEEGPRCNCGGIACIESFVGNRYLINDIKRSLKNKKTGLLAKIIKEDPSMLTPMSIDKAARKGDRFAIDFWKKAGERIGIMLSGVINFLDPDRVVIGGGIAEAGKFLFGPIRKTVQKRAMKIQRSHTKIVKAGLAQNAGLIGAAVLVNLEKNK